MSARKIWPATVEQWAALLQRIAREDSSRGDVINEFYRRRVVDSLAVAPFVKPSPCASILWTIHE